MINQRMVPYYLYIHVFISAVQLNIEILIDEMHWTTIRYKIDS